jgi:hypothetical protein
MALSNQANLRSGQVNKWFERYLADLLSESFAADGDARQSIRPSSRAREGISLLTASGVGQSHGAVENEGYCITDSVSDPPTAQPSRSKGLLSESTGSGPGCTLR